MKISESDLTSETLNILESSCDGNPSLLISVIVGSAIQIEITFTNNSSAQIAPILGCSDIRHPITRAFLSEKNCDRCEYEVITPVACNL